jgi:VIT1/CCC1 family predicted Fe2+/Mn2+ transporter
MWTVSQIFSHACCHYLLVRSFVFGAFDGLISSVTVVSACSGSGRISNSFSCFLQIRVGGGMASGTTLIIGFAMLLSNSLSMGISEFLSSKAHKEFLQAEKRREMWEFKHYKDSEINEVCMYRLSCYLLCCFFQMVTRFESRGMTRKDAELVVSKMAQYENFFVGLMVAEELGLQLPEENDAELMTDAFVMFFSFLLFGVIPVVFYFLSYSLILSEDDLFVLSSVMSLFVLTILGMVKSTFSSSSVVYSGCEAMLLGITASSIAFVAGNLLARVLT